MTDEELRNKLDKIQESADEKGNFTLWIMVFILLLKSCA